MRGGYAREIVNRIQRRRKELELNVADRIEVCFSGDRALVEAAAEHRDYIAAETLATGFAEGDPGSQAADSEIDGKAFRFSVVRAGG